MNVIRKSLTLQEVELFLAHMYTQIGDVKIQCPDLVVDSFHFQDVHGMYVMILGQHSVGAFIVAQEAGVMIFTGAIEDFDKLSKLVEDWPKPGTLYRWDWERDNYTAAATHLINFFIANQE